MPDKDKKIEFDSKERVAYDLLNKYLFTIKNPSEITDDIDVLLKTYSKILWVVEGRPISTFEENMT